jgi:hypothetical protein
MFNSPVSFEYIMLRACEIRGTSKIILYVHYIISLSFVLPLRLFWDPSNNGRVSTPFPGVRFPIVPPQHPLTAVVFQGPYYLHKG